MVFDQEVMGATQYAPLLYSPRQYFSSDWLGDSLLVDENVADWRRFVGSTIPTENVSHIIYVSNEAYLSRLRRYVVSGISSPDSALAAEFRDDALANYWRFHGGRAAVDYLAFAKKCEPYATGAHSEDIWIENRGWVARMRRSALGTLDSLISIALDRYHTPIPVFLRLRYAYQAVRLAQYGEEYGRCVALYDSLIAPLAIESPVTWWALANKAGALRALGHDAEAAWLFSIAFEHDPARRHSCFLSFRVRNDSIWGKTLSFCRSNEERETLYFLQGINPFSNGLEHMMQIYALNPGSEKLEVLLVREMGKLQDELSAAVIAGRKMEDENRQRASLQYLDSVAAFIRTGLGAGKVRQPEVWKVSLGYSEMLLGNVPEARRLFAELALQSTNTIIHDQLDACNLALRISTISVMNDAVENELFDEVRASRNEYLFECFLDKAASVFELHGDAIHAFLCRNPITVVMYDPEMRLVDSLLSLCRVERKTALEQYLLSFEERGGAQGEGSYMAGVEHRRDPLVFLMDVKATLLFAEDSLQAAERIFRTLPPLEYSEIRGDPFIAHIRDCRDCDFRSVPNQRYSKLWLVQRMIDLKEKIRRQPDSAAFFHYLVGNAYYNITHYGNASEAIDFHRNHDAPQITDVYYGYDLHSEAEYLDCSIAMDHYVQAMNLATAAGDSEMAARCCFMAAKCDQNDYYSAWRSEPVEARQYFSILKERYPRTAFFREALGECEYFKYFLEHS